MYENKETKSNSSKQLYMPVGTPHLLMDPDNKFVIENVCPTNSQSIMEPCKQVA